MLEVVKVWENDFVFQERRKLTLFQVCWGCDSSAGTELVLSTAPAPWAVCACASRVFADGSARCGREEDQQ